MGISSEAKHGGHGGGGWTWLYADAIDKIGIAEEDPEHPEHEIHMWRTDPSNPEFAALVEAIDSLGLDGLACADPIKVYLDGARSTVCDGKRRICAIRIVNAKRKGKARLECRALTTPDPTLTRNIANAHRAMDPPMVLARRYSEALAIDGDKRRAAAQAGLTLEMAERLVKCRALPPDIIAKINRLELPPDVALRLAKDGGKAAQEAVAAVTTPAGKVDPVKARKAADAAPKRPRAMSAKFVATFAKEAALIASVSKQAAAAIAFVGGDRNALDEFPNLRKAAESAGYDFEANRARAVKDGEEGDAE